METWLRFYGIWLSIYLVYERKSWGQVFFLNLFNWLGILARSLYWIKHPLWRLWREWVITSDICFGFSVVIVRGCRIAPRTLNIEDLESNFIIWLVKDIFNRVLLAGNPDVFFPFPFNTLPFLALYLSQFFLQLFQFLNPPLFGVS